MEAEQVPEVTETPATGVREPKQDSIEFAVSQLMKEPEEAPLKSEPEATAEEEPEETEAPAEEVEYEEVEVLEGEPTEIEEAEELEYYRVKLDGEEIEVTLDELQSGYQRQKDYTKKTQTLADQRKDYESKQGELETLQGQYMQQAQLANELLNRDLKQYESVDWAKMKVEDPVGYVQKQIEIQEIKGHQQALQAQAQQTYEYNQKKQAEERKQYLELQRKETLKVFPDWKDTAKASAHQGKIVEYARQMGYNDDIIGNISSANDLLVLDKARKYDEIQKTKGGIAKKKVQPSVRKIRAKGTAPTGLNKTREVQAKKDTLRKSGSLRDAAALMQEMRSAKPIRK